VVIPQCDLHARVLGLDLAIPALLAPVGYSRLMHPSGEIAASRAAGAAGTADILFPVSGDRLGGVKAASSGRGRVSLVNGGWARSRRGRPRASTSGAVLGLGRHH